MQTRNPTPRHFPLRRFFPTLSLLGVLSYTLLPFLVSSSACTDDLDPRPANPLEALSIALSGGDAQDVEPLSGGPFLLAPDAEAPGCTAGRMSLNSWFLPLYKTSATFLDPATGSPTLADVRVILEQRFFAGDPAHPVQLISIVETVYYVTDDTVSNSQRGIEKDFWFPQASVNASVIDQPPARFIQTYDVDTLSTANPHFTASADQLPLAIQRDLYVETDGVTRNLISSGPSSLFVHTWGCRPDWLPDTIIDQPGRGYLAGNDSEDDSPRGRYVSTWQEQCADAGWDTLSVAWNVAEDNGLVFESIARPNSDPNQVPGVRAGELDTHGWTIHGIGRLNDAGVGFVLSFPPESSLAPGEFGGVIDTFVSDHLDVRGFVSQPAIGLTLERCRS